MRLAFVMMVVVMMSLGHAREPRNTVRKDVLYYNI
jgi:hypothetical protein